MVHSVCVEVRHSPSNVGNKGEPEGPVEWNVIIQEHVIQTALGAVLGNNGHIGHFEGSTNKLAQVGMVQYPVRERR